MTTNQNGQIERTILLALVCLPIIGYLLYFANQKRTESPRRILECKMQCEEAGSNGYDFTWGVIGGPKCKCLEY